MEYLFWVLVTAVVWCYAGYPLYILALARLRPLPVRPAPPGWRPSVSVIVAARNERSVLAARLENLLTQDYPASHLDIIVACNGSSDGTEEIAREFAARDRRIRVLISPAGLGKAGAINMGVANTESEIVVFADARQTFARNAVTRLVADLGDPEIGAVSGLLVIPGSDLASVEGVRKYWGFEMRLRAAESQSGSVVQALGAIYAVKRALFRPVPPNLILDDIYVPFQISVQGYRIAMAPDAIGYDVPAVRQTAEFARKRRTMVGNIQIIRVVPEVLSPFRNPLFLRFVSHKLLRVLSPFCFVGALAASAMLNGAFYRFAFIAGLGVYALGVIGLTVRARFLSIPSAFVLVHAAVFAAVWRWREDASRVWTGGSHFSRAEGLANNGVSASNADALITTSYVSITSDRSTIRV